jgi:hypothetical protein
VLSGEQAENFNFPQISHGLKSTEVFGSLRIKNNIEGGKRKTTLDFQVGGFKTSCLMFSGKWKNSDLKFF